MLEYDFMQRAFAVGVLLSIIIPCVGVVIVMKHLAMVGDALAHSSLAGVAAGFMLGINPVVGAIAASIAAALSIEVIRKKIPQFAELSIAMVMSTGIGLAAVLSGMTSNAANFNSFLFGSIVAISNFELLLVVSVAGMVLALFILLYKELFYVAWDERAARLAGIPVKRIQFLFTILTAVTVSIAARTVGALIVSSMLVIPVAAAMQFGRSYKSTVWLAIGFAMFFTLTGLTLSYYYNLKPGGSIVLTGVAVLLISALGKYCYERLCRNNQ